MTPNRLYALVIVALLGGAILLGQSLAQNVGTAAPSTSTKVAVCDLIQVFNNCKKVQGLRAEWAKLGDALLIEDEARNKAVEALEQEYTGLKEGTPDFETTLLKAQKARLELQTWRQLQQASLERKRVLTTQVIYKDLLDITADVAKSKGYDIVLARDAMDLNSQGMEELFTKIAQRRLLYHNEQVNITDDVLRVADRKFQTGGN